MSKPSSNSELSPSDKLLIEIRGILSAARTKTATAINTEMVIAYWHIGKRIVEEEQGGEKKATYGAKLLEQLSRHLTKELGKGFSLANLRNFRQFYLTYPTDDIRYTVSSELSWSHNTVIMRLEDTQERQYYLKETKNQNWSIRQLKRQIKTQTYQRLISTQTLSDSEHSSRSPHIADLVKDPYVLEFLDITPSAQASENEIESTIINHLQSFLLEMGNGFSFVARQMRISTESNHFFIDLVFYNYILKCFVIIDLKTTKLNHQDIGQIDMYVRMFDGLKRGQDDNPTIGIILCADKDDTMVKYSVLEENEQLFASKYMTVLPTVEEFQRELERECGLIEHSKLESKLESDPK